MLTGGLACYNLYPAKDGRYVAVGALEPKFWANLCNALGAPELIPIQLEPESQPRIKERLAAELAKRTQFEWWDFFRGVDACVTPVQMAEEALAERRNEPIPRLSDTPGRTGGPAPALGEHNDGR
jgi:crotonobetainyl-CoA:carnitine CoA-transferase CaiB-like acyl-CoA transferase